MSFKFRLQRILELREQHEQAKARELAAAQSAAEEAQKAKDALASLRANSHAQIHSTTNAGPRVGHLQQLGTVLASLDERLIVADDLVKEADAGVHQAKTLLEDAARDRRVLDRLKERHAEAWRAEEAQKDRVQMDEIALLQFARKPETKDAPNGTSADGTDHRDGSPR
ncbi:MAG: flagellar export protein FliJ [Gemmatimonadaceae bacterium]|nr:flagellar export protein FliJ [Gemmatimonadaceae bacterium]